MKMICLLVVLVYEISLLFSLISLSGWVPSVRAICCLRTAFEMETSPSKVATNLAASGNSSVEKV